MKTRFLVILLFPILLMAQQEPQIVDEKYLEDQLYIGLTYNILTHKPSNIQQNGFSGGIALGFIKDIPLNEKRNIGLGIGLGYSYQAFIQNLKIVKLAGTTQYLYAINPTINRLTTHAIEVPLEFRWRTSTPTRYKFWRIYTGLKFSYLVATSSKFKDVTATIKVRNINEIQKMQYGIITSMGYGTWNLHVYYGLNPLFKNARIGGQSIDMKEIRVGLQFYIL